MATLYWTKAQPRAYPRIKYVCMSMDEAARKVIANKGSAGVDGTTVASCCLSWKSTGVLSTKNWKTEPISLAL